MAMTLAQLRGFIAAVERIELDKELRLLHLLVLGTRGEQKALDKATEQLRASQ